jgi:hypothetical protein
MQRRGISDWAVFVLLVVIAILGRHERIDWNFTPIAAATLFAGYYFRRVWIAAIIPVAALLVSDRLEPSHANSWVMLTVWGTFAATGLLGPWLRRAQGLRNQVGRGAVAALAPSAVFFLTTNFAVWATEHPPTLANLAMVYLQGIPFYRSMLAGDLFYLGLFFGAYAIAVYPATSRAAITSR